VRGSPPPAPVDGKRQAVFMMEIVWVAALPGLPGKMEGLL